MGHLLNRDEIESRKIIDELSKEDLGTASYNLRVGDILTVANKKPKKSFDLPPQGVALIVSKEVLEIPEDIQCMATVKNSLSMQGILAINIGLIDPTYSGPISSILINFGKKDFPLEEGQSFLRLTFHEIDTPKPLSEDTPKPVLNTFTDREDYIKERYTDFIQTVDEKFLSLGTTTKAIEKNVWKEIRNWIGFSLSSWIGFILTISILSVALLSSLGTNIIGSDLKNEVIEEIRSDINSGKINLEQAVNLQCEETAQKDPQDIQE